MISQRGKTVKFSEKFLMLKDIHFYLLCLVLNRPVTILGKKLVLNLRLTLCVLKTLLLIVQFLNMNQLCNILDFLILTSTETLSSLLKCISARIHTFAIHCTLSNIPIPATTFSLLHKSATPSFIAVKPSKHSQTR